MSTNLAKFGANAKSLVIKEYFAISIKISQLSITKYIWDDIGIGHISDCQISNYKKFISTNRNWNSI